MTDLERQIRELLLDYLSGAIQLDALRDAQVELQLKAEANNDIDALDLADQVELLLAEFSNSHRTESSVRSELHEILSLIHWQIGDRPNAHIEFSTAALTVRSIPSTPTLYGKEAAAVSS